MSQPLADVRVVELATGISGPYCGKLFADFGADVVKVEPPQGDESRAQGPFPGEPDPEQSSLFLHLNTNKRSATLDVSTPSGRDLLRRLCATADVVIDDGRGLGFEELREARPEVVLTSVTPFGLTGPYAGRPGAEIVYYAMGGPMHATGVAEREPVKHAGNVIQYQAGNLAATATLAALMTGEPVHVDVSNFEAQAGSIDRRLAAIVAHAYSGAVGERNPGTRAAAAPNGIYPVADGYVQVITIPAWIPRMLATLDDAGLTEAWQTPGAGLNPEVQAKTEEVLYGWLLTRTKQEAMLEAESHQWPVTALNLPVDVVNDPHFGGRGFLVDVDHPRAGRIRQPGAPFRMTDGWTLRRPAPLLGQHNREIYVDELGLSAGDLARLRGSGVV